MSLLPVIPSSSRHTKCWFCRLTALHDYGVYDTFLAAMSPTSKTSDDLGGDRYDFISDVCTVRLDGKHLRSDVFIYNDTTRSVCRELCSRIHGGVCSSVLFDSRTQSCVLSSDTGSQIRDPDCGKESGREFYRRRRKVGKTVTVQHQNHTSL